MSTGITIVVNRAPAGPSSNIQRVTIVGAPDVEVGDEDKHLAVATVEPLALEWVDSTSAQTVTAVKTADYTAVENELVRCNPTGGAFTVTLPTAVGASSSITVKNVTDSENAVTVATTGGETIDDSSTRTLDTPRISETYVSDGSNWMVM
jgi:hypothetical protein